jgi:MOSC domain-containing protein YiiM
VRQFSVPCPEKISNRSNVKNNYLSIAHHVHDIGVHPYNAYYGTDDQVDNNHHGGAEKMATSYAHNYEV